MSKKEGPADPIGKEMGRRMRDARDARNWTIDRLAAETGWSDETPKAGIHPSTIAMYERGERRVPHETAIILERIFGAPVAYWLATIDEYEGGVLTAIRRGPQTAAR
jgi:transcriptional regulator with XRE-family HTH domain